MPPSSRGPGGRCTPENLGNTSLLHCFPLRVTYLPMAILHRDRDRDRGHDPSRGSMFLLPLRSHPSPVPPPFPFYDARFPSFSLWKACESCATLANYTGVPQQLCRKERSAVPGMYGIPEREVGGEPGIGLQYSLTPGVHGNFLSDFHKGMPFSLIPVSFTAQVHGSKRVCSWLQNLQSANANVLITQ